MKRCPFCGYDNSDTDKICRRCGEDVNAFSDSEPIKEEINKEKVVKTYYQEKTDEKQTDGKVRCPRCNSTDVHFVTKSDSDFDGSNACCGYILFGPIGLLCGLTGNKENKTVRKCMNCNHEF
jgi:DNA-directed RNA polymerase subunit RPC12/RpoP